MTQISLYHRSRKTGQLITVDDHLAPIISRVHWSTGDIRRPQSPRYVARFKGEPFTISLNRLVYALSHTPNLVHMDIFFAEIGTLKRVMSLHPPLVFEDGNVLNCTLANIIPRALSRKGMKPRDHTSDGDSPPLELPLSPQLSQDNVTTFPQAPKMIQYGEKGVGKSDFVPHSPRDVNDGVDLSKLFTHLDASSDVSLTNKKGHTDDKRPA